MASDTRLGGRPRKRLTEAVRARTPTPVCPLCRYPIDRTLKRTGANPHPLSSAVDEWYPRHLGGDPHDEANCVELHRLCNGIKSGAWPVTEHLAQRCRTQVEAILNAHNGPETQRTW